MLNKVGAVVAGGVNRSAIIAYCFYYLPKGTVAVLNKVGAVVAGDVNRSAIIAYLFFGGTKGRTVFTIYHQVRESNKPSHELCIYLYALFKWVISHPKAQLRVLWSI